MLSRVKHHLASWLPAFRSPNYRLYFAGQGISLIGSWMQVIAEQWLVYPVLTQNKSLLGLESAVGTVPTLAFVLFAGVLVDRIDKRKVFLSFQIIYALIAFALYILIATHHIQVWHLFLAAFISGTVMAFENPTRQTFMIDLVDKNDLPSALSLSSAMFNSARAIGPALAGLSIAAIGIAPAYLANTLSFFAVIGSLLIMKFPPKKIETIQHQPLLSGLKEGFVYINNHKIYLALLGIVAVVTFFTWPVTTLLPVFAHDIFKTGEVGFGLLESAFGIGAVIAGLSFHTLYDHLEKKYMLFFIGVSAMVVMFSCFAWVPWFWGALVFMALGGLSMSMTYAAANTIIIMSIPDYLRGRMMSIYMFVFLGGMPVGALISSALVTVIGPRMTVFVCALATGVSVAALIALLRGKFQEKIMAMV